MEGGEPRRVAHPGRRDVAPEQRGRGGGGGGLGGMTLREVGSKGRLASVAPGGGVGIGARLPSTETLVREGGLLGASSSYGGGMGGNSSGDLVARGFDSEMVEAMERDPFGDGRSDSATGDPTRERILPDDYVERHAIRRASAERTERAAREAAILLKDADARRAEARRMEAAAAGGPSPGWRVTGPTPGAVDRRHPSRRRRRRGRERRAGRTIGRERAPRPGAAAHGAVAHAGGQRAAGISNPGSAARSPSRGFG